MPNTSRNHLFFAPLLALLLVALLPRLAWSNAECGPNSACAEDLQVFLDALPTAAPAPDGSASLAPDSFLAQGLRAEVLSRALTAFNNAWQRGDTRKRVLTIIDYSLPSNQRRLWVVDLDSGKLLFNEYVAHGRGSGNNEATAFSNVPDSKKSNIGLLRTAETYNGKHGYSLKLDGLEPGWNDNARERAIVMHSADYATAAFAEREGRLGRSWGCPAVDPAINRKLIDTVKGGSLVFAYYPDSAWLKGSSYLKHAPPRS